MENLFTEALPKNEADKISAIKTSKAFALRLLSDLKGVYRIFETVNDQQNGVVIEIRRSSNIRQGYGFNFIADMNGVRFVGRVLGYRVLPEGSDIKTFGWIMEKYSEFGSKAESRFMDDVPQPFGYVDFVIPLKYADPKFNERIRDVMKLLDKDEFNKNF